MTRLVEFEGYFRSEQFVSNALGLRKELANLEPHNGTTITDLENLVSRVSAHAEKGQDIPEITAISPAPPSPLCDCGEPATKKRCGVDLCDYCYDQLREDQREEDAREQFYSVFPAGRP